MSVITKLSRRAFAEERGGALIGVIGMMVVAGIVATSVATSTVTSLGRTSTVRAGVQSEAAAETGVNATELGLRTAGDCAAHVNGVYSSVTNPVYTTQVSYYNGSGWVTGCPDPATATQVKIVSTGTAAAPGTSRQSSRDSSKLEATYPYTPATGGITGTGSAVYGGSTSGLNNLTINTVTTVTPGGSSPDVVVKSGSFTCQGNTIIAGNLIVQNGSVELNGCIVLGSVKAAGYVNVNNGSRIDGDVIAAGLAASIGPNQQQGSTAYVYNSTVKGNVWAGGKIYLQTSKILKSVTGATASTVANLIAPDVTIGGSVAVGGTVSSWGLCNSILSILCTIVSGTLSTLNTALQAPSAAPPAPTTTAWAGYTYDAAAWAAAGYTEKIWTGSCTIDNYGPDQDFIKTVMASTTPIVVNALACPKLLFSSSAALQLKLNANVAFVSKSFGLENITIDSATSASLKAWFVVPGTTPKPLLTVCADIDGKIDLNSGVKVTAKVSALLYSPGCINESATVWQGQIYGGTVNIGSNLTLNFVPVGLPGTSLDGTPAVAATAGILGARTLLRDVQR